MKRNGDVMKMKLMQAGVLAVFTLLTAVGVAAATDAPILLAAATMSAYLLPPVVAVTVVAGLVFLGCAVGFALTFRR